MENYETPENKDTVFAKLDGTVAHIFVIVGFVLALLAPLIPNFKNASTASAWAAVEQAQGMILLDLEDYRLSQDTDEKADSDRQKELDKKLDEEKRFDDPLAAPEVVASKNADRQRRSDDLRREIASKAEARGKTGSQKREELEKKYNLSTLKREALDARTSATGARWHMVIGWLGSALLLIGLIVLVSQSQGTRQKVLLVVLVVVMFSALAGLSLNFRADGSMGDNNKQGQAAPAATPAPTPSPTPGNERILLPPPGYNP